MTLAIRHGAAALLMAALALALVVAALAPRPAAAQTSGDVGVTIAPAFSPLPQRGSGVLPSVRLGRGRLGPLARARGLPAVHARGRDGARDQRAGGVAVPGGERAAYVAAFGANMRRGVRHQVGAALDWPAGRRFFVRVDARLVLFRVGIGAGIGS